jgi:hypothetical protein
MRGVPVWERDYYEKIILYEEDADDLYAYIEGNPGNWSTDELFNVA